MFSGCPKPEITSFHLYMGPLVHPTNRDRFAACPSARPSIRRCFRAFTGERMQGGAHMPDALRRVLSSLKSIEFFFPKSNSRSVHI